MDAKIPNPTYPLVMSEYSMVKFGPLILFLPLVFHKMQPSIVEKPSLMLQMLMPRY